MPLNYLDVHNVRIIQQSTLEPGPSLNVLAGPNASGKTSLLEAIHILGMGRSFRSYKIRDVISKSTKDLMVHGRYLQRNGVITNTGIKRQQSGFEIKINGATEDRIANLAKVFPLQCITPENHHGFLHSAKQRRALLDWGLFHVEQEFYPLWIQHRRLLQQRSACLKSRRANDELEGWDEQFVSVGEAIQAHRSSYLAKWNQALEGYIGLLGLPNCPISLELCQGWRDSLELGQALAADRERDQLKGVTHSGPHRADLRAYFGGEKVSDFASHGQQKLLVIALRLAQMELFFVQTGKTPILLLDDLPAELDRAHRTRLMEKLAAQHLQIFATTTDAGQIPAGFWSDAKVFHVEQGHIRQAKTAA